MSGQGFHIRNLHDNGSKMVYHNGKLTVTGPTANGATGEIVTDTVIASEVKKPGLRDDFVDHIAVQSPFRRDGDLRVALLGQTKGPLQAVRVALQIKLPWHKGNCGHAKRNTGRPVALRLARGRGGQRREQDNQH